MAFREYANFFRPISLSGGNEKDTKSTFLLMTKSLSEMIKSESQNFQGPCGLHVRRNYFNFLHTLQVHKSP